jgi:hypothetical protein
MVGFGRIRRFVDLKYIEVKLQPIHLFERKGVGSSQEFRTELGCQRAT